MKNFKIYKRYSENLVEVKFAIFLTPYILGSNGDVYEVCLPLGCDNIVWYKFTNVSQNCTASAFYWSFTVIENILQFVSEQVNPHTSTSRNQQVNLPKTSLFLQEEMMANVQKPGSAQRNIPSSKPIRTDFRINYANFFGTDN